MGPECGVQLEKERERLRFGCKRKKETQRRCRKEVNSQREWQGPADQWNVQERRVARQYGDSLQALKPERDSWGSHSDI